MNLYLLFSSIFMNHSITFCVFVHWLTFNCFIRLQVILSKMIWLIVPISFLDGLINLTVGLFWKFFLWSLRMKKQILSLLISSRCKASLFFKISFPYLFISSLIFVFVFLYFEVIVFRNYLVCLSVVSRYMLEFLSVKVIVFFELWINLMSYWSVVGKSLLAFLNLMSSTKAINSFSNAESSSTCFGQCNIFSQYFSNFLFCLHPASYMIAFYLILFINFSIFSTNCNFGSVLMVLGCSWSSNCRFTSPFR